MDFKTNNNNATFGPEITIFTGMMKDERPKKIDYNVGDLIESRMESTIGTCTGFCYADTCVMIDGKCYGGKYYFRRVTSH
jgi:hypothetical protein